jgi:hypothetical protein
MNIKFQLQFPFREVDGNLLLRFTVLSKLRSQ